MTADADDGPVLDDHVVDGEALAHLGAGGSRRVDEDLVEHGAARTVGNRVAIGRTSRAVDLEHAEVEAVRVDGRAASGDHLIEHAPALQCRDPGSMDQVGREGVARERRPVDDEHLVALASQQHGGGGAGAPGAHDDGVIGLCHVCTMHPRGGSGIGEVPYSAADFARAA